MKESLRAGIEHVFDFTVSDRKTVPALFPESTEFQAMPKVFATGYFVGFIEWACIAAINPHIDWPVEQTVGIHINVSHVAATPPGMNVRATVKLREVHGRRLVFEVKVFDVVELIGEGTHERFVIYPEKFEEKMREKREKADRLGKEDKPR